MSAGFLNVIGYQQRSAPNNDCFEYLSKEKIDHIVEVDFATTVTSQWNRAGSNFYCFFFLQQTSCAFPKYGSSEL